MFAGGPPQRNFSFGLFMQYRFDNGFHLGETGSCCNQQQRSFALTIKHALTAGQTQRELIGYLQQFPQPR